MCIQVKLQRLQMAIKGHFAYCGIFFQSLQNILFDSCKFSYSLKFELGYVKPTLEATAAFYKNEGHTSIMLGKSDCVMLQETCKSKKDKFFVTWKKLYFAF